MNKYHRYQKFRQEIYQMLGKAKDATFELGPMLGKPQFIANSLKLL